MNNSTIPQLIQDKAKKLKISPLLLTVALAGIAEGKTDIQVFREYLRNYPTTRFKNRTSIADKIMLDGVKQQNKGFYSADNYFDFNKPLTNFHAFTYHYVKAEIDKLFTDSVIKKYGFNSFLTILKDKCKVELTSVPPTRLYLE
jgi:hypothetical protein